MAQLLFSNEFVRCELEPERSILKHTWLQSPSSDDFKKNLLKVLAAYNDQKEKFDNLKWLADTQKLGERSEGDEVWLEEEWDRMLFNEAGVKAHAVILGTDILADYPMEMFKLSSIQKNTELGVELEVFSDEEKAYAWLEKR